MSIDQKQLSLDSETWVSINGFSNYQISSMCRVRNTKNSKILIPTKYGKYLGVALCKNGKITVKYIHKLIGEAFVANPYNYNVIDHIDRNVLNNSIENIRWVSYQINNINRAPSRKNKHGCIGLNFDSRFNAWQACWVNPDGSHHSKSFSVGKYSNAKELAINFRKEKEKNLSNYKEALEQTELINTHA